MTQKTENNDYLINDNVGYLYRIAVNLEMNPLIIQLKSISSVLMVNYIRWGQTGRSHFQK